MCNNYLYGLLLEFEYVFMFFYLKHTTNFLRTNAFENVCIVQTLRLSEDIAKCRFSLFFISVFYVFKKKRDNNAFFNGQFILLRLATGSTPSGLITACVSFSGGACITAVAV